MENRVISAQQRLRSLENSAEFLNPSSSLSASDLEQSTPVTTSFYNPTHPKNSSSKPAKTPKHIRSKLKSTAPFAILLGLFFALIFFLFGSMSFLGAQMESLLTRATDTMFGSYNTNTVRVTTELLAGSRGDFPDYMKTRLEKRDITVEPQADGSYHLIFHDNVISADNFKSYYDNDPNFRDAFTSAKRGRSSNFFDVAASLTFTKINLSRNIFRNFSRSGNEQTDLDNYKSTQSKVFEGGTNTSLNTVTEKPSSENNTTIVASGDDINSHNTTGSTARTKAASYLSDISKRVSDAGGITCAALKVGNLVATAITVNEIYQAINFFADQQENISKTLAGDGENAGANFLFDDLSEEKTTTYIDATTGEEKTVTGSSLSAEGFANTLAGEKINTAKTANYSTEASFRTITSILSTTTLTAINNKLCGGIRVSGAVISLASFAVGGALIRSTISLASKVAVNAAIGTTISAMLSALIPRVAQSLFTNTYDSLEGIPHGETYVKGVDLLAATAGRESSGQLLATKETATAYNTYTTLAASQEAELDRLNRSPLDLSSPNTFLGSVIGKLAIIGGTTNIFSTISKTASITNTAGRALLNSFASKTYASISSDLIADNLSGVEFKTIFQNEENCLNLASIGAACDAYGAEIPATDPNVINISSSDPTYQKYVRRNITKDSNGFQKVIEGSTLSKKIKYCDSRHSPFGILDANILNDFETSLDTLNYVPFVGDAVEIYNAVQTASPEAEGWATGAYCVLSPESNPYYEELTYLQHYEEDQRIASQMHLAEVTDQNGNDKNPVTAYKSNYESSHPLDTSDPTSIISYFTGSTREDAELAISCLSYIAYLNDYTPPHLLPSETIAANLSTPLPTPQTPPDFTDTSSLTPHYIIYDTLREKYHAA